MLSVLKEFFGERGHNRVKVIRIKIKKKTQVAHPLASGPDAFNQNLNRPSRSDLGQFCTI